MMRLRNIFTRALVCLVAALLPIVFAASQAFGAEFELKFYWVTSDNPDDPYAISGHTFKEILEKKTEGRVVVHLFPNGVLGNERDAFEGLTLGTIDMGAYSNAFVSGFVKEFQTLDLPFVFSGYEQVDRVLDGPFGKSLLKNLERVNVVGLGFTEGGFREMINKARPIKLPEDMRGVKFRVMENPIYVGMFKNLGSNPTPIAWSETFTATQQGTVDGLEIPIPVIHQNKYYEVTKYLSLTHHTYSPLCIAVSKRRFERFPADIQAAIRESVDEMVPIQRKTNRENIARLQADLRAKGMEVNEIQDAALFREKVRSMYQEYADVVGKDVMDAFFKATGVQ
ncbi:MAG: TRAP transporter substrate-binding protein [Synergistaceae bacterium]|jgi:tripartite ATP-independent transporter DctP family solute receptor|nr:TRAP transporter substrate-binding protein [Synergistaceae bacterium]